MKLCPQNIRTFNAHAEIEKNQGHKIGLAREFNLLYSLKLSEYGDYVLRIRRFCFG